jgi:hypothetical protein
MMTNLKGKIKYLTLLLLFLAKINSVKSQSQSDPKLVVLELFKAAQTNDYSKLTGLCDPQGEGDGDVKQICNLQNQPETKRAQFAEQFKKGRVVGDTEIKENFAQVKIKFGKNGKKDETVVLVKRGELWYLFGM